MSSLLLGLPRFADQGAEAYKPGLDRMLALLREMGDPHLAFPAVHVAGTNGKGSTSSFVAAIGTAGGRRVGLHTSPHLHTLGERMRVDGQPAPEAWLERAAERYAGLIRRVGPSFFEATLALSLLRFAEEDVDAAVVEVGLGGRLDATNVLGDVRVSLVTHIGLDHTDLLGDTLGAIAREKAGIARPGVPLLSAVEGAEARAALLAEASARGASVEWVRETVRLEPAEASEGLAQGGSEGEGLGPEGGGLGHEGGGLRFALSTPRHDYGLVRLGLAGAHQAGNAVLAVRAAETLWPDLPPEAVRRGLAGVRALAGLRGRLERVAPRVVADVAHNADGWRAALQALRPEASSPRRQAASPRLEASALAEASAEGLARPPGRLCALVGVMADKDAEALARLLKAYGVAEAYALDLGPGRALSAEALADLLRARGVPAQVCASAEEALALFNAHTGPADTLLATGSHLVVAAVREALAR